MTTNSIPSISAAGVFAALSPAQAVEAIEAALVDGLNPADDKPRHIVGIEQGQLLLMPAETPTGIGVKALTLGPGNPATGIPRIQGVYLFFDPATLAPTAVLDGSALTTLRTPAVSVAAVRRRLVDDAVSPLHVVCFGGGPQAVAHVRTLRDVLGRAVVVSATYVVRQPERADRQTLGGDALISTADVGGRLDQADVVVCATTSTVPPFDSSALKKSVVVIAVGSHEPTARELDGALLARAQVVVEDVDTALREAGDIVMAVAEGAIEPSSLITMSDVVAGRVALSRESPVVFKGTGMSWEDLVVAEAVLRAL